MKKRLISLLLAVCMAASVLPVGAFAAAAGETFAYEYKGQTLNYKVTSDSTVEVAKNTGITGTLKIPETVYDVDENQYTVTAIGQHAFAGNNITEVEFPATLKTIGTSAFLNNNSLKDVEFPEGLTTIGNYAFGSVWGMTKLKIPASVTRIGGGAFQWCGNVTSIEFGAGIQLSELESGLFDHCRKLQKVVVPESVKKMTVLDASKVEEVASQVDFVFCAVNMPKDEIKALEEAYAKAECPVVSNNSAHRFTSDVPMVVPEINADHIEIIPAQRKRLGTKRGFIAVKSNCSLQSYVPALHPLMKDFGVSKALVCTYQAISGAGKTFDRMPEIVDNVIPYIGGEEEKSEREPLKLWGHIEGDQIVNAEKPVITAQCFRVPVSDGHTAAVFVSFDKKPTKEQMLEAWANFRGPAQELNLPSAPKQFLHYFTEPDRPQPKLDRNTENGMAVCIGRLREDTLFDYKFACMSHNTLRGAAGGAVLLAELLAAKGYMD
mgnify:CR=1 FL=1